MSPLRRSAAVLLLCAVSCSHKSPEAQLVKSIDAAASWVPALQMTAEKWVANSVPGSFAGNAADAALKEFEKAQKAVDSSKADHRLRQRIAADFAEVARFAETLHDAADRDDPGMMVSAIRPLPRIRADLDAIRKQYGGGS